VTFKAAAQLPKPASTKALLVMQSFAPEPPSTQFIGIAQKWKCFDLVFQFGGDNPITL
jgi:hypothetical protein